VRQLIEDDLPGGYFRLPDFQRPYVWTDAQALRLLDSIERGYHIGSLLLWDRDPLPPGEVVLAGITFRGPALYGAMVVDGQQRLGAIAQALCSGRFAYDCTARRCVVDEPMRPDLFPLAWLLDGFDRHVMDWISATPSGDEKWVYIRESFLWREVSIVCLPRQWTLPQVIESFRRLNTEGTRFDPADLETAIARALSPVEVQP
jgi:hypothetical protein